MDWVTTGRYNKRMAKRMFSDEITTTDAFLDMPSESQLLYFHIGMTADDDGFIGNAKMIQRSIGASDDSMKILIVKKFIISFNNGVMVVKHWRINNFIRGDIYKETKYLDQRKLLNMRDNGSYSLNKDNAIPLPRGYVTIEKIKEMNRLPELESSTVTEPLQNSNLDKIRLDKIRLESEVSDEIETKPVKFSVDDVRMVDLLVSLIQQNTPSWSIRGSPDKWAEDINKIHRIDGRTYEQIEYMIRWTQKDSFWSQNILSASKLREKFNDLIPRLKGRVKELNYIL